MSSESDWQRPDIPEDVSAWGLSLSEEARIARALFENAGDAMLLLDTDGFLDCNGAAVELFGLASREDLIGIHPAEVSTPRQPDGQPSFDAARERIAQALREGSARFEWLHARPDGTPIEAEVMLTAFRFGDRDLFQAVVRDISDRKRLERAVEERRRQSATLMEVLSAATSLANAADTLEEACAGVLEAVCTRLGWAAGGMLVPDHGSPSALVPTPIVYLDRSLEWEPFLSIWRSARWSVDEPTLPAQTLLAGAPTWHHARQAHVDHEAVRAAMTAGIRTSFGVPVMLGKEPVAVLVFGGLLHLSVLIENMRREGYELAIGKPKVIYRELDGKKTDPLNCA